MADILQRLIDFVLGNVGLVVFVAFLLFGLLGRDSKKNAPTSPTTNRPKSTQEHDDRPLAERLAEAFGVDLTQQQSAPEQRPRSNYGSEGRRSTTQRNVQENYPQLFGGSSLFDSDKSGEKAKWGFEETEWGTTFEKNEEQWGGAFSDHKSSEPRIEWPSH